MAITPEEFIKGAEEKAPEQQWRHRWFTTIIPYGTDNKPLVCNYCPNCRATVAQAIMFPVINSNIYNDAPKGRKAITDKLDLPKYGCDAPEGM